LDGQEQTVPVSSSEPPPETPIGPPGYPAAYPQPGYPPGHPLGPPLLPPPDLPRPRALHFVLVLLLVNLALSIGLTIAVLILHNSVLDYQLDHRHVTDPDQRRTLRDTYRISLLTRVGGNILVSVVYAFIVRALLRGRRWAYRRVIFIGAFGILSLLIIQGTPYPPWMRAEQLLQALVLAGLLFLVLRPEVRAHYAKGLPGRDVRRFRRQ
jgi:hypothetical protein